MYFNLVYILKTPTAIFDQPQFLKNAKNDSHIPKPLEHADPDFTYDYHICISFLLCYQGSPDTFNAYRREIERFFQWCLLCENKPFKLIGREELYHYINFAKQPPKTWIGTNHHPRFIEKKGLRVANSAWKPFIIKIPKALKKQDMIPENPSFQLSQSALKSMLAILSTFFTFLQQEQYTQLNPVRLIRQKSSLIQKTQVARITRKLTHDQWQMIITSTSNQCIVNTDFERHLFILSCLYLLGLRISELAPNHLHQPTMGDFSPDESERWWFMTIGKGNKLREIAVPDSMLQALKRYRTTLSLTPLPLRKETTPLIPKTKGSGGLGIRQIRNLVQESFDLGIEELTKANQIESAQDLSAATVHWLRHTSITADIKHRPREHVRDDAGHQNANITDRYIDSDRSSRHNSARNKPLVPEKQKEI